MNAAVKSIHAETRKLGDLSLDELVMEVRMCHEMFGRCLSLLNGEHADPVELFMCDELGDNNDMELYYKCLEIYGKDRVK